MPKQIINSVKLGLFVLAGLVFLVILLYMIGKNRNLFGNTYVLKTRFENVQGLVAGNNIRFSGIQAGTVKDIEIVNDTVIEVTMSIETKMKNVIRKNALAYVGTEGVVGNKVVNIIPGGKPLSFAEEGDMLASKKTFDTDDMLQTLSHTNNDIAVIAAQLKITIQNINNSTGLWTLLNDNTIPADLKSSFANVRMATWKAAKMMDSLQSIVMYVKNGNGSIGEILTDTSIAKNMQQAIVSIKSAGEHADSVTNELYAIVDGIKNDVNNGNGTINALLKDSTIVDKINASLSNVQKGTDGFNQSMEALKHNFLLRGYFRKLERRQEKETKTNLSAISN